MCFLRVLLFPEKQLRAQKLLWYILCKFMGWWKHFSLSQYIFWRQMERKKNFKMLRGPVFSVRDLMSIFTSQFYKLDLLCRILMTNWCLLLLVPSTRNYCFWKRQIFFKGVKGSSGQSGSAIQAEFDRCLFSSFSTINLALPVSKSSCTHSCLPVSFLNLCAV